MFVEMHSKCVFRLSGAMRQAWYVLYEHEANEWQNPYLLHSFIDLMKMEKELKSGSISKTVSQYEHLSWNHFLFSSGIYSIYGNIWIRNFWFHAVFLKLLMAHSFESILNTENAAKWLNRKNNGTNWSGSSIRITYRNKAHLI